MASIEYLNKRIDGKRKEIEKLTKKLERIEKAEATGWEVNPYYYSASDKKWTLRDLEAAKAGLEKYEADLKTEEEKAGSRNVEAILTFLENWKKRVTQFYTETFEKYPAARKKYEEDMKQFSLSYYEEQKLKKTNPDAWKEYSGKREEISTAFEMRFKFLAPYIERCLNPETYRYDMWTFDNLKLAKDLKEEAERKYDDIINRTNEITGKITDASCLGIGEKGELNGYIIGERGTAKVTTIGAGGYNIQCYHFRTLVHAM